MHLYALDLAAMCMDSEFKPLRTYFDHAEAYNPKVTSVVTQSSNDRGVDSDEFRRTKRKVSVLSETKGP